MIMGAGWEWLGPAWLLEPEAEPRSLQLVDLEDFAEVGQTQLQHGEPVCPSSVPTRHH